MRNSAYGEVLAFPGVMSTLLLGLLVRLPGAALGVILTLHVVALGRSYGEAGLVTMALTVGMGVSGPWRGRMLDRKGLRRVVTPSLVVLAVVWALAPRLDYGPLLVACGIAGLFAIPAFSIVRQAIIAAVPPARRRSALALDAVAVELSFMFGPLVGVWAATTYDTGLVLAMVGYAGLVAGVLLWLVDPPIVAEVEGDGEVVGPARWFTPAVGAVFLAAVATTILLAGTDLGLVAATRAMGATPMLGVILAVWCIGSLVGGLIYGAQHRAISSLWLLIGLGFVTMPLAFANHLFALGALCIVAGVLVAPTTTAMADELGRLVPPSRLGEAMGWHGTFMQVGSALGAPLTGLALDRGGAAAGFLLVGVVGVAMGAAGIGVRSLHRRRARVLRPAAKPW